MLRRLCTAIATTMFSSHSAMFMFQTKSKASRRWTANSLTAGPGLWRGTLPTSQSISQMGWRLPQPFILRQFNRCVAKGLVLGRRKMAKRLSSVAGAQLFS